MAAGPRGLLAFWMGGAAAAPVTTTAGARGLLAHWIGGASAPPASGTQAGYRGVLGFWAGGYAAGPAVDPPAPSAGPLLGGPDRIAGNRRRIELSDNDLMQIAVAIIVSSCLDD
jgi:hypothetical protein